MPSAYLEQIKAHADPARAEDQARYHKIPRVYLGVPNPVLNDLTRAWRKDLDVGQRVDLARHLWDTNIFEARLAAAKLLTQARIRPDNDVWTLLQSWRADFDSWAIADHVCMAAQKRLAADPSRLDQVETWTRSSNMWTRRAALVATLPWAKMNHPRPEDIDRRDRILGWAASYVPDRDWFIQKAIAWWIRDLSKHDASRARRFLDVNGPRLKAFALREATKYLGD